MHQVSDVEWLLVWNLFLWVWTEQRCLALSLEPESSQVALSRMG